MELYINDISSKSMGFHLNPLYVIESPIPKTYYVDVPFADGSLDLTEAVTGKVQYQDRLVSLIFERLRPKDSWQTYYNNLVKSYHGKTVRLVMPDMEGYHFIGRMTVGQFTKGDYLSIPCEVNCKPYKFKDTVTSDTFTSTTTESVVILQNEMMETVPTFTTNAEVTVKHGANSYVIGAGTHKLAIVLKQGANSLSLIGNASVTISYQEGVL